MARTPDGAPSPFETLATLLRQAERRVDEALRASLQPLELTPRQYALLSLLGETPMSQQEASRRMGIDRTTMVGLVDGLEAAELVVRERHPSDRRAHVLVLSSTGDKRRKQAARAVSQLEGEVLRGLDEKDLRRLGRALRSVAGQEESR